MDNHWCHHGYSKIKTKITVEKIIGLRNLDLNNTRYDRCSPKNDLVTVSASVHGPRLIAICAPMTWARIGRQAKEYAVADPAADHPITSHKRHLMKMTAKWVPRHSTPLCSRFLNRSVVADRQSYPSNAHHIIFWRETLDESGHARVLRCSCPFGRLPIFRTTSDFIHEIFFT